MEKKLKQAKPVKSSFHGRIRFPERVWEIGENGWSSRPVTPSDRISRNATAKLLNCEEC